MGYTFYFEKLTVWQNARKFLVEIYSISESFPNSELFGLTSQLKRSSLSICSNIAEGFSRQSNKEKCRFLSIAYSSTWEVLNLLIILHDLKFITPEQLRNLRQDLEQITNQLNTLYRKVNTTT